MRVQGDRELQEPQGGGLGSRAQRQPGEEGAMHLETLVSTPDYVWIP